MHKARNELNLRLSATCGIKQIEMKKRKIQLIHWDTHTHTHLLSHLFIVLRSYKLTCVYVCLLLWCNIFLSVMCCCCLVNHNKLLHLHKHVISSLHLSFICGHLILILPLVGKCPWERSNCCTILISDYIYLYMYVYMCVCVYILRSEKSINKNICRKKLWKAKLYFIRV